MAVVPTTEAQADVLKERCRQVTDEGWTYRHDDAYSLGTLTTAGVCYALSATGSEMGPDSLLGQIWPWDWAFWKPKTPRQDLVRAAALIIAEIERMDRAEE